MKIKIVLLIINNINYYCLKTVVKDQHNFILLI
jgi:hypothetical protein